LKKCLENDDDTSQNQFDKYKLEAKKTCPYTYENIIIILTDGDVGSVDRIFQMVRDKKYNDIQSNTRIFSFGLGNSASKQFFKEISNLTFGDYAMIGDNEDLIKPVEQIIQIVSKQYYTHVKLVYKDNVLSSKNSIYPNKSYSMIYEVDSDKIDELKLNGLKLEALNPITKKIIKWDINFETINLAYFDYSIIKQLYFNECIRKAEKSIQFNNLTNTELVSLKEKIVKMSIDNNIMNQYTSFVLVDNSSLFDVEQIGKRFSCS